MPRQEQLPGTQTPLTNLQEQALVLGELYDAVHQAKEKVKEQERNVQRALHKAKKGSVEVRDGQGFVHTIYLEQTEEKVKHKKRFEPTQEMVDDAREKAEALA